MMTIFLILDSRKRKEKARYIHTICEKRVGGAKQKKNQASVFNSLSQVLEFFQPLDNNPPRFFVGVVDAAPDPRTCALHASNSSAAIVPLPEKVEEEEVGRSFVGVAISVGVGAVSSAQGLSEALLLLLLLPRFGE